VIGDVGESESAMNIDDRIPNSNGTSLNGDPPSMELTSDEVNFLVFRYLQEAGKISLRIEKQTRSLLATKHRQLPHLSHLAPPLFVSKGFVHSAFTFINESMLSRSNFSRTDVPPGALISFLQKGLQYLGIEETIRQDGGDKPKKRNSQNTASSSASNNTTTASINEHDLDFSLLSPNVIKALLRRDPPIKLQFPEAAAAALRARLETEAKMQESQAARNGPLVTTSPPQAAHSSLSTTSSTATIKTANQKQRSQHWSQKNQAKQQAAQAMAMLNQQQQTDDRTKTAAAQALESITHSSSTASTKLKEAAAAVLDSKIQQNSHVSAASILAKQKKEIETEDLLTSAQPLEVLELNKHTSEVFMCAWNPVFTELLATGSGDASARIWTMGGKNAQSGCGLPRLLQHGKNTADKKNKDVTTLDWSSDGELLATGSYDGVARVWKKDGSIVHTLCGHMGPIFSLKWNKKGNFLLSGSYDKTTIVWNVEGGKGEIKEQFRCHSAPALDVDWKDNETFASCSTDKSVLICQVGSASPLMNFTGHKDEVNAVKWDPSGTLLASCSDDCTAKVWCVSNGNKPLHDFQSHKQEIYTVKW
jgi:transducin (beta)-like 1